MPFKRFLMEDDLEQLLQTLEAKGYLSKAEVDQLMIPPSTKQKKKALPSGYPEGYPYEPMSFVERIIHRIGLK